MQMQLETFLFWYLINLGSKEGKENDNEINFDDETLNGMVIWVSDGGFGSDNEINFDNCCTFCKMNLLACWRNQQSVNWSSKRQLSEWNVIWK